jgi:hypothetical protein
MVPDPYNGSCNWADPQSRNLQKVNQTLGDNSGVEVSLFFMPGPSGCR